MSATEARRTVSELRMAQPDWEAIGVAGRVRWLRQYRDWLLDNSAQISSMVQAETQKAWPDSTIEPAYAVEVINYYGARAARFLADDSSGPSSLLMLNKRQRTTWRPYPVVGVIAPWNFPVALAMVDALPALFAGATAIIKPSEFTPKATEFAVGGWSEIGAPPVFTCLAGDGATGAALVDEVDFVQFTGSTRTGRAVAERAADRLIPCSLELGGKDAMLVLDDADLTRAARGAVFGGMFNSGQACVAVERVYVMDAVYEDFIAALLHEVGRLRQGVAAQDYSVDIGALTTDTQADLVAAHVDDARAKGARVLVGGNRDGPRGYAPTVLVDVDHTMACMTEESFGPLLPVMGVPGVDEAVRLANDSRYGLSASVWTKDRRRGEQVAARLEVGAVNINDVTTNLMALGVPHSGWKQSGLGARHGGAYGVRKYCHTQVITSNHVNLPGDPHWFPYSKLKGAFMTRAIGLSGARDRRRIVRALIGGRS